MADVQAQLADGATLGRPHLADALVAKKIVKSREEAFNELLHNNSPHYVGHYSPTPEVAIAHIKKAGGVAIIAHPFASLRGRTISVDSFAPLVAAGLDGIEIEHRDHADADRALCRELVDTFHLIETGSSDYHGTGKLNLLGESTTSPENWEALVSRATGGKVLRA